MSGIKTAIVLPDTQIPFEDERSLKAVEQFMSDNRFDYWIQVGDFLDYFTISKYNADKPGLIEGKTVLAEVEKGEQLLQRHIDIIKKNNKNAEFYLLEGNHEYRATAFTQRNPHLRGIIEPEVVLKLKDKGVKYIKSWSEDRMLTIGKANFIHGHYTNQHHAKKTVEAYDDNIFYGHVHDIQCFSKTKKGTDRTRVGQSLGCLCDYDQIYVKGSPTNWQQAFAIFEFLPNGYFTYNVIRIINHQFIYNGKVYKG